MKGILNLLLGIFAIGNVGYNLYRGGVAGSFFGFVVSSPVYCLIWSALAIYFLSAFYRMNKKPKH